MFSRLLLAGLLLAGLLAPRAFGRPVPLTVPDTIDGDSVFVAVAPDAIRAIGAPEKG